MKSKTEILNALAHEYGSDDPYTICALNRNLVMTGGIIRLRENADCHWLIDAIASYRRKESFQVWTLEVFEDKTAILTMKEDSGRPNLVEQKFHYTDFPLEKIELWVEDGGYMRKGDWVSCSVLMIPSER